MKRLEALWVPYALIAITYGVYAAFTETGPVGWFNVAQQAVFGSYSLKLSAAFAILVLLLAGALVFSSFGRLPGPATDVTPGPGLARGRAAAPASEVPMLFKVFGGMVVVTWVVGLVACLWLTQRQDADNTATYRPVVLQPGITPEVAEGERLALRGELLERAGLSHFTGSDANPDYTLVPLVAPGWRRGQQVTFVARADRSSDWEGNPRVRGTADGAIATTLLVRVGGAVGVQPGFEFSKRGAPLAERHHLVTVVASKDGRVIERHTDYLQYTLWSCGLISGLTLLMMIPAVWSMRRRERRG